VAGRRPQRDRTWIGYGYGYGYGWPATDAGSTTVTARLRRRQRALDSATPDLQTRSAPPPDLRGRADGCVGSRPRKEGRDVAWSSHASLGPDDRVLANALLRSMSRGALLTDPADAGRSITPDLPAAAVWVRGVEAAQGGVARGVVFPRECRDDAARPGIHAPKKGDGPTAPRDSAMGPESKPRGLVRLGMWWKVLG
jgi:hypothetical protein